MNRKVMNHKIVTEIKTDQINKTLPFTECSIDAIFKPYLHIQWPFQLVGLITDNISQT